MQNLIILTTSLFLSWSVFAAEKIPAAQPKATEMTIEKRETMAKSHEAMAACLRSDKAVDACHEEMMASCKANSACPGGMMGHHMGKGMKDKTAK